MRKPTIYEALKTKLGREPTNAELNADVKRILGHHPPQPVAPDNFTANFATCLGITQEQARAQLWPDDKPRLAKKPQNFDTSALPLFGDSHKQTDLF